MNLISVVTSLYHSESYISPFYCRAKSAICELGFDYEFIFVNDASPDNSSREVQNLMNNDEKITLIELSRNFGQYPAMFAGMKYAKGDLIYILDCDLEEEPGNIKKFYKCMQENPEIDVVYGEVESREGGFVKRKLGKYFHVIMGMLSDYNIPQNQAWSRLMKRSYLNQLLSFKEAETFPAALMYITGFNQKSIPIKKNYKGSTSYSFIRRMRVALSAITSFSSKPLIIIAMMGLFIFIFSMFFIILILIQKLLFINFQVGWASIIASIWASGGLIIFSIGIVGLYVAKIFNQVKNRPLYIIKSIINKKNV